jgi:hypothetical protein
MLILHHVPDLALPLMAVLCVLALIIRHRVTG